jgi:trehalose utilization protein
MLEAGQHVVLWEGQVMETKEKGVKSQYFGSIHIFLNKQNALRSSLNIKGETAKIKHRTHRDHKKELTLVSIQETNG